MREYRDIFMKIIIFGEENEFGDRTIKIIKIPNTIFSFSFICNIVLF